jgi:hypothetical protein
MKPCRRLSLIVLVLLAWLSPQGYAQGLTGALLGTVKDINGGVIQGAAVRVTSAALMAGGLETVSNARGQWRLPVLPPGEYVLTVDASPRFSTYRGDNIRIGAGQSVEVAVVLQVAGVTESVTVRPDETSAVSSGMETRFGPEFIRLVPTRRYSLFSLAANTPGVSATSPTSGSISTLSVFGSAVNENAFLIDGTNFTCPCQGVARAEPIIDAIEELHVQTMGASVEFGNLQGGVFNVVTRQGGARFSAETSYYAQPSDLTAQPVVLPVKAGTVPSSGYARERYRDLTGTAGGPIRRDRLWFFAAGQYLRDYDSQPGADPAFPRTYEQNKVFAKLNWRLPRSMQMMQSFHEEKWVNPTPPTLSAPFVTTQRVHASVPNMTFVHITQALSDRTVWEARVGRFLLRQDADPSSGDRTTPSRSDQITGVSSGNAAQITTLHLDRATAKGILHRYQPDWLGTDHEFKLGAQIERGAHRLLQVLPGGVRYVDSAGLPFQAIYRSPSIAGGVFVTTAAFASDRVTAGRVTADAGIRFDHNRAINPDLPAVSADGRETSDVARGIGTLYTQSVVSPRVGLTVRLDRAGQTILRGSYGRFNQGILTGELDPISQGTTPITTMAYDAGTGGYTRLVSVVDSKVNVALDPKTRTPHTDEYSLALDRELGRRVRMSLAYISKRGSDFIGWIDRGGQYSEELRTIAGQSVPVFVLTNATSDRRFFLTNASPLFVAYDGLVIAAEKRMSGRWMASGSYTYSRSRGLQVISNGAADDPQFSTIARPGFLTFGQDPNDLTNAAGRLPNDRPHVARGTAAVRLPWNLRAAANLQAFSGKPWAATAQVTLPQGSRRILLEPRGSRRLSTQTSLDARVSRAFTIAGLGTAEVMLDVLNALNDSAEEALVSDNIAGGTFGAPRLFVDPRRAMFGVRLNLGR